MQWQRRRPFLILLFGGRRAAANQPGLAPKRSIVMNNSALGRFVDGRDKCGNVAGLSLRIIGAFVQRANATRDLTIAESAALSLACTFGGGFRIGHERNNGRERHGCFSVCQPRLYRSKKGIQSATRGLPLKVTQDLLRQPQSRSGCRKEVALRPARCEARLSSQPSLLASSPWALVA